MSHSKSLRKNIKFQGVGGYCVDHLRFTPNQMLNIKKTITFADEVAWNKGIQG